jgi:hypothetical protein
MDLRLILLSGLDFASERLSKAHKLGLIITGYQIIGRDQLG